MESSPWHTHTHTQCAGHKISPSLLIPYSRATWLATLCKTRGPSLITTQCIWEHKPDTRWLGPFGRALHTLHAWGWKPKAGWWEWAMPGSTDTLHLTGDHKLVKHNIREQLRSQLITTLIARRLGQFAGMHYHTNRRLINASIASFMSELERALLRTLLAGALWTAVRAYQRGLITSPLCPYSKATDETEEHILWHCTKWSQARDTHIQQVHALAAKIPELPPFSA